MVESKDNVKLRDDAELEISKPVEPKVNAPRVINVSEYEYVLAIPKSFVEMDRIMDKDGVPYKVRDLVLNDWQSGVQFYINGLRKTFRELQISLDDHLDLDRYGKALPILPKVKIVG